MKEYNYNIIEEVYNWMLSRKKDIEIRILKEKSLAIQPNDYIIFHNQDNKNQFIKVKIINKTIVNNIDELLNKFDVNRMMPDHSEKELKDLMFNIYGNELKEKAIVAFEFEFISSDKDIN